ncbi:hypothetical protein HC028_00110 [Planosporangium flavigriseum]|uniref:Uncharacterized protein n=1 Tax=Planosporangium flavigriseum TaxID=373681 RepID=A0A8J3LK03_9ACTN|nr:hypothetical protein [Planosporangium flavigriseum]NJC62928.1 hypothetical protein [Planosporangium flavigriseum]GIG73207.1 hypothetical protein Pfl04_16110 [Planosporangium flavigriseum]
MDSASPEELRFEYCSDVDGVRFIVVDDGATNLSGWRVEVKDCNGNVRLNRFERHTVWGVLGSWNFLGYGEKCTAWAAVADHGEQAVVLLAPDGRRVVLGA